MGGCQYLVLKAHSFVRGCDEVWYLGSIRCYRSTTGTCFGLLQKKNISTSDKEYIHPGLPRVHASR